MEEISKQVQAFQNYVQQFNLTDRKIALKIKHTYKVVEQSEAIAKSLQLEEKEIYLAKVIGLLHDIGRFEQLTKYHTFSDKDSIDHATLGVKILFQDKIIQKFHISEIYNKTIEKAIENHNKIEIDSKIKGKDLLQCRIVRDADKIDIYRVMLEKPELREGVDTSVLSDTIRKNILEKHTSISHEECRTELDKFLICIAYIYDINYPYTFRVLEKENYINRILDSVNYQNEKIRKDIEEIRQTMNTYVRRKSK